MEFHRVPAEWTNSAAGELLDRLAELEWWRHGDELTSVGLGQVWDILDPLVAGASDDEGPAAKPRAGRRY